MLTAYLDESGQEQDDWMFIAGFLGDDSAWEKFPALWADAIGPQRRHLHMKSLRFNKGPVRNMLKRAASVPKECGLVPLLVGIRLRDYVDLLTQEQDILLHSAYAMCFKAITTIAMRSIPDNERLEVVFERQDRYGWDAASELQRILETNTASELLMADGKTSKLANCRFVDKDDTSLCEPADYLAYAALQRARDSSSLKAKYTNPILSAYPNAGFGALLQRSNARGIIIEQKRDALISAVNAAKQFFMDIEEKRNRDALETSGRGGD